MRASHHAAKYQDKQKTAYQLGHSSLKMLDEHYWKAVQHDEAMKFWNLSPNLGAAEGQQDEEGYSPLAVSS
jgi:hypothetical protein